MTRSLRLPSLMFWLCLASIPDRTFTSAVPETDAKHLSPLFNEHKGAPVYGHGVQEKRKRGGRNHLVKRCNASDHAQGPNTPSSSSSYNMSAAAPSGSKKWGLAWPNGEASYLANFARPKVGYIYTWSPYLPSATTGLELEGIPMLWGWDQVDDFKDIVVQGYATKVLGMNEPNEPSQSYMSPQDGVSLWKQYIDPLKSQGYYLISPACTNDQAGLDWMKSFVDGCTDCTIDAIAFHFYGTDPGAFVTHATTLYQTYNKPIWATEFADQNFSGSGGQPSIDDVYAFQSAVIEFVENTPWFEAAFPFGVMHDLQGVNVGNALLTADEQPTSLAYNYFG